MNKIDLIIDALSHCAGWGYTDHKKVDAALAAARELKTELAKPESINHAAWHWHNLYQAKCQEFHDKQTTLGTEIVALEEELAELKEEQLAKPEQVADAIELNVATKTDRLFAATELRRLYEENATLKKCLFQMQNAAIELAKPEQEPVAWVKSTASGYNVVGYESNVINKLSNETPLYTAPPRKEWVGLTDEEIHRLWLSNHSATEPSPFSRVIEAKLKEKNS